MCQSNLVWQDNRLFPVQLWVGLPRTKVASMNSLKCLCKSCGREYEYNRSKTSGHTKEKCNSCKVNLRRFAVKERCLEYKGGKCERCGYDKCKRALCFHHVDSQKKEFTIAKAHCRKWEDLKAELDKCILVCSNCHMEIHEELKNL